MHHGKLQFLVVSRRIPFAGFEAITNRHRKKKKKETNRETQPSLSHEVYKRELKEIVLMFIFFYFFLKTSLNPTYKPHN